MEFETLRHVAGLVAEVRLLCCIRKGILLERYTQQLAGLEGAPGNFSFSQCVTIGPAAPERFSSGPG